MKPCRRSVELTVRQREMLLGAVERGAVILLGRWDRRIANGLAAKGLGWVDNSGSYVYGAHFVVNEAGRREAAKS